MILPRVSPAVFLLSCLCMRHAWCLHASAHVWAFCVVEQEIRSSSCLHASLVGIVILYGVCGELTFLPAVVE